MKALFHIALTLLVMLTGLPLGFTQSFDLLVLGVSQDAGYPQAGCRKQCCIGRTESVPVASIAVHIDHKFWIIDATPDFTAQLALAQHTFPQSEFAGILLTHAHIGHYTGLMYLGREAMNTSQMPVYCMPLMAQFLRENGPWSQLVELGNIEIIEITNRSRFPLSQRLHVIPMQVPHRYEFSETTGFKIISPEKSALYIPDIDKWDKWHKSIELEVESVDIALLDATFYDEGELPGRNMAEIPHPFVVESIKELAKLSLNDKNHVYFTHFNHTNPLLREGSERKSVEEQGFHVAKTGLRL